MGVLEIVFVFIVATSAGYQAGKAGQRVEAINDGKICFDEAYGKREAGCYSVSKKPTRAPASHQ